MERTVAVYLSETDAAFAAAIADSFDMTVREYIRPLVKRITETE